MLNTFKELMAKKKTQVALITVFISGAARLGFEATATDILVITSPLFTLILGISLEDIGKARQAMINAQSALKPPTEPR